MYRNKIVWLFAALTLSLHALAGDALPGTKVLIERAYYWDKLGRSELAAQAWQEVLLTEPGNAEALAALAGNKATDLHASPPTPSVVETAKEAGDSPPVIPRPEIEIAAKPIPAPVLPSAHDIVPAETYMAAKPGAKGGQWPDYYPWGMNDTAQAAEASDTAGGVLVSANPSRQELIDRAKYWDSHGRSDLADKLRAQHKLPAPTSIVVAVKPEAAMTESGSLPTLGKPAENRPVDTVIAATVAKVEPPTPPTVLAAQPGASETTTQVKPTEPKLAEAPAQASAKPTAQELAAQEQYWAVRGRSDLAEKSRGQLKLTEPKQADAPNGAYLAIQPSGKAEASTPEPVRAPPTLKEMQDQAQYWEARGRSDLADRTRTQAGSAEPGQAAVRSTPMLAILPDKHPQRELVAPETSRPAETVQELGDKAEYWEARGRGDLADQLRQKLQTLDRASGNSLRTGRSTPSAQPVYADKTQNNQDVARTALEDSLLRNPGSLKTRLDLAQIYQTAGETAKARVQVESILATSPDLPDALYVSARLYAEQRLWWDTLHTLERVPTASRTADMAKLQKMAWAHVQLDRADALVRQGNSTEAEILLRQVAAELAVNYNQTALAEPPPLWKSAAPNTQGMRAAAKKRKH